MGRRSRSVALLVAGTLVLVCGAGASPNWHPPVRVSSGDRALGPELVLNPAGDAAATWDQEVGEDCATSPASLSCIHVVQVASRLRGAAGWQTPVDVARPGVGAAPQIAINPSGDVALAWVHDIGRDRVLQASIRRGATGEWPNPNDLSDSVLQVKNQRIALDTAGDAIAVWAQRTATSFVVHGEVRPAAAGVWGSAIPLSSGNATGGPALQLAPDGDALAAWIEDGVVRVSSGDAATGVWQPGVTLSRSGGSAQGDPDLAADSGGDAIVTWAWRKAAGDAVVHAAYRPAGGGWSAPVEVGGAALSPQARVAIDAVGNALAIWLSGASATTLRSAFRGHDGSWSRPVDIARNATEPRVSMSAIGNAVAVWTNAASGTIEAALRSAASGEWALPSALSASGASASRIAVPVAMWNRSTPTTVLVEEADLVGGGPLLSQLEIPTKTRVRMRVTFSVKTAAWSAPVVGAPLWRFGDGASATGARTRHTYRKPGRYRITVTQADAAGGTSTLSGTISVRRRSR